MTFCYAHVQGVTLARTLDDDNLPIVNLTSLLKVRPSPRAPGLPA